MKRLLSQKYFLPFLLGGCFMVLGTLTLDHYGVGWDNPIHYKNGQYTVEYVLGISNRIQSIGILRAPLADMLSYLSYQLLHVNLDWVGEVSGYHLPFVIFGALTVGFLTSIGLNVSPLGGIISGGLLFVHPLYFGWSHLSMKDIPLSFFFLLTIMVGYWWIETKSDKFFWMACVGFALGFAVKATILLVIPALVGYQLLRVHDKPLPSVRKLVKLFGIGLLLFWITTIVAWPTSWNHPLLPFAVIKSLLTSLKGPGAILYQGKLYQLSQELPPWHYIPWMLIIKTPLVHLAGLLLSPVALYGHGSPDTSKRSRLIMLGWTVIAIGILAGIIHSSSQYDVDRHYIFLYPFVALIAGLSWSSILTKFSKSTSPLFLIGIIYCIFRVVSLHPNEIVFYNDLVGRETGAVGEYPLDYYGNAYRQGTRWLNNHLPKNATVYVPKQGYLISFMLRKDLSYRERAPKNAEWAMILNRKGRNPFRGITPDVVIPSKNLPLIYIYKLNATNTK